jgi:hypothetical protein
LDVEAVRGQVTHPSSQLLILFSSSFLVGDILSCLASLRCLSFSAVCLPSAAPSKNRYPNRSSSFDSDASDPRGLDDCLQAYYVNGQRYDPDDGRETFSRHRQPAKPDAPRLAILQPGSKISFTSFPQSLKALAAIVVSDEGRQID